LLSLSWRKQKGAGGVASTPARGPNLLRRSVRCPMYRDSRPPSPPVAGTAPVAWSCTRGRCTARRACPSPSPTPTPTTARRRGRGGPTVPPRRPTRPVTPDPQPFAAAGPAPSGPLALFLRGRQDEHERQGSAGRRLLPHERQGLRVHRRPEGCDHALLC